MLLIFSEEIMYSVIGNTPESETTVAETNAAPLFSLVT